MSADTIQNQAPLFIVFDGMDGTGKTTQMRLLCERLNSLGMETVLTCEPSTSPDGQALRHALSGKEPANHSRMGGKQRFPLQPQKQYRAGRAEQRLPLAEDAARFRRREDRLFDGFATEEFRVVRVLSHGHE